MRRNVSVENCVHAKSCPQILNTHIENCTIIWSNKVFRGGIICIRRYFGVYFITAYFFTYHNLAFSDINKYKDVGHYNFLQKSKNMIRTVLICSVKKCWILLSISIIVANFLLAPFSEGIRFTHSCSGYVHKHTKLLKQLANVNCVQQRHDSQSY